MSNILISSFPKIFAIGSKQTQRLFEGEVEITEKIDGSQIGFGVINKELIIRSKGAQLYVDNPEKMFKAAIDVIVDRFNKDLLWEGVIYYGEYMKSERHNVIRYGRIPHNHIALYGVYYLKTQSWADWSNIEFEARRLDIETVPFLHSGVIESLEELKHNINRISALGKEKIEGFVVKNYAEQLMIGGQVIPILMGKYVSEDFKEVHKREWKATKSTKGKWDIFKSQFRSNARWVKAVHYLRDAGTIQWSPKDIGNLIKRIQQDIQEEEAQAIKEWLFNEYKGELLREAVKGFPEWYKEYLLEKAFDKPTEEAVNE